MTKAPVWCIIIGAREFVLTDRQKACSADRIVPKNDALRKIITRLEGRKTWDF